ncbi:hypothetical protein ACHAPT_006415 [Fusarium lateritium]
MALTLFLSEGILSQHYAGKTSKASYVSDDPDAPAAEFKLIFREATPLVGYAKAKLWVSADEADDMDIYLFLRKISREGKLL